MAYKKTIQLSLNINFELKIKSDKNIACHKLYESAQLINSSVITIDKTPTPVELELSSK